MFSTFPQEVDISVKCFLGDGSDDKPFVVGVTTKSLLRSANRDPASVILHVDATFQLDQVSYPVIVWGLSDGSRRFHLLALFLTSQLEEAHFFSAFAALRAVFAQVTGERLSVRYVMGDADSAQFNAMRSVFRIDCTYTYLIQERMRGLHGDVVAMVNRDIYDLHISFIEDEYFTRKKEVLFQWNKRPELDTFRMYMEKQWLSRNSSNWQCYLTPSGFATTNNPCETLNRAFKTITRKKGSSSSFFYCSRCVNAVAIGQLRRWGSFIIENGTSASKHGRHLFVRLFPP
ncbi:hypothetical protein F441_08920 [Phytophthora nicotianae CJ01A1]|uniref:Uncharacterized protein n=1 Tax=Phytophthora nicotianae CJ01A1 TaxID=1317063 RepID=W2X144_PHYNI|nr:hypothetical protein F441_08920 [Phytophthora nicotianae CJ01A1]